MNQDIRPCPCCHGVAEIIGYTYTAKGRSVIRCTYCGLRTKYYKYVKAMIKAWNKRT